MKLYLAPLEGVTDVIYRNTFYRLYGGVDKMFTPFLSPGATRKFPLKEWENIDPRLNDLGVVVPQLLTRNSEDFLWAAKEIANLGFKEVNLNLGCPSGTVVAKKKGSGLLFYPEELEVFLDEIFEGAAKTGIAVSIKTRVGKVDESEWDELLFIFNRFPISELTIHPRLTKDFYKGEIRMNCFEKGYRESKMPVVYNGDLRTALDVAGIVEQFGDCSGIMLGRGLIANPNLARQVKGELNSEVSYRQFHDELFLQYEQRLSGETPLLHRMKEMWSFWRGELVDGPEKEKVLKALLKTKKISEYRSLAGQLLE